MTDGNYLTGLLVAKIAIAEIDGDTQGKTRRTFTRKIMLRLNELISEAVPDTRGEKASQEDK